MQIKGYAKTLICSIAIVALFHSPIPGASAQQLQDTSAPTLTVRVIQPSFPQCSNGLDDDLDGVIDYPADPGCESTIDNDETDPVAPSDGSSGASAGFAPPGPPLITPRALALFDFNRDGRIDMVDLSILLFHADKPNFSDPNYDINFDFNADGLIDLVDISIFLYYWTG
jgi:hypothetical protein